VSNRRHFGEFELVVVLWKNKMQDRLCDSFRIEHIGEAVIRPDTGRGRIDGLQSNMIHPLT